MQTLTQNPTKPTVIIIFWPIYNVYWNLHANSFRGICIKSTNSQAKTVWKQLISFAQVIKFSWKIKLKGSLTPTPFAYVFAAKRINSKWVTQCTTVYKQCQRIKFLSTDKISQASPSFSFNCLLQLTTVYFWKKLFRCISTLDVAALVAIFSLLKERCGVRMSRDVVLTKKVWERTQKTSYLETASSSFQNKTWKRRGNAVPTRSHPTTLVRICANALA